MDFKSPRLWLSGVTRSFLSKFLPDRSGFLARRLLGPGVTSTLEKRMDQEYGVFYWPGIWCDHHLKKQEWTRNMVWPASLTKGWTRNMVWPPDQETRMPLKCLSSKVRTKTCNKKTGPQPQKNCHDRGSQKIVLQTASTYLLVNMRLFRNWNAFYQGGIAIREVFSLNEVTQIMGLLPVRSGNLTRLLPTTEVNAALSVFPIHPFFFTEAVLLCLLVLDGLCKLHCAHF